MTLPRPAAWHGVGDDAIFDYFFLRMHDPDTALEGESCHEAVAVRGGVLSAHEDKAGRKWRTLLQCVHASRVYPPTTDGIGSMAPGLRTQHPSGRHGSCALGEGKGKERVGFLRTTSERSPWFLRAGRGQRQGTCWVSRTWRWRQRADAAVRDGLGFAQEAVRGLHRRHRWWSYRW